MVQIVIKVNKESPLDEYVMIELQGDLESKGGLEFSFAGEFIGDLHFNDENVPILIIGHHIVYGKCVKLDKPLAVLQKRVVTSAADDGRGDDATSSLTEYFAKAIIRQKLQFKGRPKPIVATKL